MKAVWIKEYGGTENLEIRDLADPPRPSGKDLLIKVMAAGLNRADLLQRRGFYPAPPGDPQMVPGLEFAGEVVDRGEAASKFGIGARVFGITGGGAQCGLLTVSEGQVAGIPSKLSFSEAAAIPEAFVAAEDALFRLGGLRKGERLLIHAVGSGVGLAALQVAKAHGAWVAGTSRTPEKLARCKEFGLDQEIIADKENDLSEQAKDIDVVLDLVGAKYFASNLNALANKGRLILVGLTGGSKAEFDMSIALRKRLEIKGTVLRSRNQEEKAAAISAFCLNSIPLLEKGILRPNLDRIFKLDDIREAHEYLESNKSFGKVVLEIQED